MKQTIAQKFKEEADIFKEREAKRIAAEDQKRAERARQKQIRETGTEEEKFADSLQFEYEVLIDILQTKAQKGLFCYEMSWYEGGFDDQAKINRYEKLFQGFAKLLTQDGFKVSEITTFQKKLDVDFERGNCFGYRPDHRVENYRSMTVSWN